MSARDYPRLDIVPFGRLLLDSGDLDPIYVALVEAELPHPQLSRWLVAYWCTYHAGFASWASDATDDEFWDIMAVAACNADAAPAPGNIGRWPRAAERRHWRGAAALKSVNGLARAYLTATNFVDELSTLPEKGLLSYEIVRARVKRQYAFGDWIAFKIADMLERVCDVPIDFGDAPLMYDDPRQAAVMLWRAHHGYPPSVAPKDEARVVREVVSWLAKQLAGMTAPPDYERELRPQELETILCKWKSHMRGHYPLYNDLREISAGVAPWEPHSATARLFQCCLPEIPE